VTTVLLQPAHDANGTVQLLREADQDRVRIGIRVTWAVDVPAGVTSLGAIPWVRACVGVICARWVASKGLYEEPVDPSLEEAPPLLGPYCIACSWYDADGGPCGGNI
jgi:hypothetical protein